MLGRGERWDPRMIGRSNAGRTGRFSDGAIAGWEEWMLPCWDDRTIGFSHAGTMCRPDGGTIGCSNDGSMV